MTTNWHALGETKENIFHLTEKDRKEMYLAAV